MPIEPKPKAWKTPTFIVEITAQHIDTAIRNSSSHCMIADAIRDAMPGAKRVDVNIHTIAFTDPLLPRRYFYLTPRVAQDALIYFDEGTEPPPFTIRLRGGQVRPKGGTYVKAGESPPTPSSWRAQKAGIASAKTKYVRGRLTFDGRGKPIKVGGTRPPQFAMRREYGVRRFLGGFKQQSPEDPE